MPGEYLITLDSKTSPVQHGRHRFPIKVREETETQLKEMRV